MKEITHGNTTLTYDIVVIGAGIHGTSIACEANSRGLNVLLLHDGDIGGSASCIPLILLGAGLESLEQFQIPRVLSNAEELRYLHAKAPHLVRPTPTYIVNTPEVRSQRKVKIGLGIYGKLQGHALQENRDNCVLNCFHSNICEEPATEFSINYLRIVIGLIQRLKKGHSTFLSHHQLITTTREKKRWKLEVKNIISGRTKTIVTKFLINCAGSKSVGVLRDTLGLTSRGSANQCESSFLFAAVPNKWHSAAILQLQNKSFMRVVPFDKNHLCIGPICNNAQEDSLEEVIRNCLSIWNQHSNIPIKREQIIHKRCTALPQLDDPSKPHIGFVQDAYLDLNNPGNAAPLLNLFGIDLVQFRKIAEQALDILEPFTKAKVDSFYRDQTLLGGDFDDGCIEEYIESLTKHYVFLPQEMIERLVFTYGKNSEAILSHANTEKDLGIHFGHGLYEAEVNYLKSFEWATNADDILWRRTYLGLSMDEQQVQLLAEYLA